MTPHEVVERASGAGPLPPSLLVRGLSKSFGPTRALADVDLRVDAGTVHALLGENGSGKSTLIKTLSGYHHPDPGGSVEVGGQPLQAGVASSAYDLGCRFVHQDLGLVDTCSVADNVALTAGFPTRCGAVRRKALRRRTEEALQRLGLALDPDTLVGGLAAAERTGVAVARALADADRTSVRLLVLDEPTATLPDTEVKQLLAVVRAVAASGVGVLYVTHHLDEVFEVADDVSVLRDGRKVVTTKARALTRRELVEHLVGGELEEVSAASGSLPTAHAAPVLRVQDLSAGPLVTANFTVRPGEVVGVAGLTGSGRETLLPAIFGAIPRSSGRVQIDDVILAPGRPDRAIAAGLTLLPADRVRLGGVMSMSARENLTLPALRALWRAPRLRRRLEVAQARTWFERLDVRPRGAVDAPLGSFSGGNQQKVLFGKWLRCAPRVLLLDEPTQGVDIGAKAEIHRQILSAVETGAAAVVSSSDYDELVALCRRVMVLRDGRFVAELSNGALTVAEVAREALGSEDRAA
ncbi:MULTISPECIES: sugar ABC transporter ATP-binding protein [unclassified Frankia]|uniref:sugar ABC transporter ATP-binding protein n=1 Tax=unclassified Frankia TaxID=2632575 RepID=UPI002024E13E